MDESFWNGRWARGETGWHQDEVEEHLKHWFSALAPSTVLVPLCGKSHDLSWLASRGHEVVGVELNESACKAFFEENGLAHERLVIDGVTIFRGGRITILNTNFFSVNPARLTAAGITQPFGAVYDRAALIALPTDSRSNYATHLSALLRTRGMRDDFRFLTITLERTPSDDKGPPFSVAQDELEDLYEVDFGVKLLSRELIEPPAPTPGQEASSTAATYECVYALQLKAR